MIWFLSKRDVTWNAVDKNSKILNIDCAFRDMIKVHILLTWTQYGTGVLNIDMFILVYKYVKRNRILIVAFVWPYTGVGFCNCFPFSTLLTFKRNLSVEEWYTRKIWNVSTRLPTLMSKRDVTWNAVDKTSKIININCAFRDIIKVYILLICTQYGTGVLNIGHVCFSLQIRLMEQNFNCSLRVAVHVGFCICFQFSTLSR